MFAEHRKRFLELLRREGAAAVIPTAGAKIRNNDCHYRFRPESDFWYLTGFAEPDSALVLVPGRNAGEPGRSVLFLRNRDKEREIWDGRRLGVENAVEKLGVDEARPIEDFWKEMPRLLSGWERIVWRTGAEAENDRRMMETLRELRGRSRGPVGPPVALVDPLDLLHELRLRKDEQELACMRQAAAVSSEAHHLAMANAAPGGHEREIEALLESTFRRRGSTGPAYASIVAGGANACVLHYVENERALFGGELLLIDAGAEWDYYASDVTRTFPVDGRFTSPQRAVYEIVLGAQRAAIECVRPGASFEDAHHAALRTLVDGMLELGWLSGTRESIVEQGLYRRFFMHRTGHWLGLDVHDCGRSTIGGKPRLLEPGMVVTVEPGLYVAPDDEGVAPRWRGIGVRIEDDLLVTASGHEILTAAIPKNVEDVEEACQASAPALFP
jgi:Xaa-Pro aminopeptidase